MLLIATPKSASTSLTCTISKILNIEYSLGIPAKEYDIDCEGFIEIQKYHNNMIERSPIFLKQVTSGGKTIFKEHLLPTKRHMKILEMIKQKVVILLRDSDDIVDSYRRHKIIHDEKYPNNKLNLEELENDIRNINDTWRIWASNKPYAMTVEYKNIVLHFQQEIKKIISFYGCKIPTDINKYALLKKKYTGVGLKRLKEENCY